MHTCSIHAKLTVVAGDLDDYKQLALYHYHESRPVAVEAVFCLKAKKKVGALTGKAVGVIVYTMPNPRVELRAVATGDIFTGLDRQTELALLNRNIRCIARVVIEPRFRGIGLASRLVRETMPKMNVPIIEALGVMPLVNPFLERAGMKAYEPGVAVHRLELLEALDAVGVEERHLIDPPAVQQKLNSLRGPAADFIEACVQEFLKSHGSRRTMAPGLERTRYVLGKLTRRPAYYIWCHPDLEVSVP